VSHKATALGSSWLYKCILYKMSKIIFVKRLKRILYRKKKDSVQIKLYFFNLEQFSSGLD